MKISTAVIKVHGLHCVGCAANIDLGLEEIDGVTESNTNYARGETRVKFDYAKTNLLIIKGLISKLGYQPI